MNIAVINLKDISKYLVRIAIIVIAIIVLTRFFSSRKISINKEEVVEAAVSVSARTI